MTYEEMTAALAAVHLGIRRCLMAKERLAYDAVLEYAQDYGKLITSKAAIVSVLATIDLDKLNEMITEISGADRLARIKALRDVTAMPLLRCKQALEQHNWDMVAAQTYLRTPIGLLINERPL